MKPIYTPEELASRRAYHQARQREIERANRRAMLGEIAVIIGMLALLWAWLWVPR